MIASYCKFLGAKVIVSEPNENRIAFLESLGIKALNPNKENVVEEARKWNGGKLFDVTFECCGAQASYDLCLNATRRGGTFMFVGVTTQNRELYVRHVLVYQMTIIGVNMYETRDYYRATQIVNSGEMDEYLSKFVTHVYPLEDAYNAFMKAMDPEGKQVKVLLDCEVNHNK